MANSLKKVMKKEFDKDKNYNEILSKVERVSGMKKIKMKYLFAPALACIAVIGIAFGTNIINNPNNQDIIANKDKVINNNESKVEVAIVINKLDNIGALKFDAETKEIQMEDISEKFDFAKKITVPSEYKLAEVYTLYTRTSKDGEYNILHDYVLNYAKDNNHSVRIAFSRVGEPIRDYSAQGEKVSTIGNTEIIICKYEDMYIATFKHKDVYIDIETLGFTETELTDLLVSIIK